MDGDRNGDWGCSTHVADPVFRREFDQAIARTGIWSEQRSDYYYFYWTYIGKRIRSVRLVVKHDRASEASGSGVILELAVYGCIDASSYLVPWDIRRSHLCGSILCRMESDDVDRWKAISWN